MKHSIFRRCGWVVLLLASSAALAQPAAFAERYSPLPASADGIGKRYMGPEISTVMGWQGAAWLEREERDREERTDLLLAALALQPGMVVADIGAGTGYLSRRMAPAVMPGGKVWAVDVQPEMIRLLQAGAKCSGLTQIEARLGAVDDARLPAGSVDLAVMVDVHHELAYPCEVMASVMKALKPGGRVVFVEYKAEDPRVPIKPPYKMSEAQIKREAAVFASSVVARIGVANHEAITAAKGGVEALGRSAAATYVAPGLRVNAVAPGVTEPPMTAGMLKMPAMREGAARQYPLGGVQTASQVAEGMAWLLGDGAARLTGQVMAGGRRFTTVRPLVKLP